MKNFLIKLFLLPWRLSDRSNCMCLFMIWFVFIIAFSISIFPVYLIFNPFVEIGCIYLSIWVSIVISIYTTCAYPMIASKLTKKLDGVLK